MKKHEFILGTLCGALVFGGGTAIASGILANPSTSQFYVDGQQIQAEAYNINGNNYYKLRDIAAAIDFGVTWDAATDTVYVDTTDRYTPPQTEQPQLPDSPKVLNGEAYAREDFSQAANPAIFTGSYTRTAYNAARQSILDRDVIIAGNNADGYNPNYRYADCYDSWETHYAMDKVLGRIYGYYFYNTGAEPGVQGYYQYPSYFVVNVKPYIDSDAVDQATAPFITSLSGLSDREKVIRINDYVCEKLTYGQGDTGIVGILTSTTPVKGVCANYSQVFNYLCECAGIPSTTRETPITGMSFYCRIP